MRRRSRACHPPHRSNNQTRRSRVGEFIRTRRKFRLDGGGSSMTTVILSPEPSFPSAHTDIIDVMVIRHANLPHGRFGEVHSPAGRLLLRQAAAALRCVDVSNQLVTDHHHRWEWPALRLFGSVSHIGAWSATALTSGIHVGIDLQDPRDQSFRTDQGNLRVRAPARVESRMASSSRSLDPESAGSWGWCTMHRISRTQTDPLVASHQQEDRDARGTSRGAVVG